MRDRRAEIERSDGVAQAARRSDQELGARVEGSLDQRLGQARAAVGEGSSHRAIRP